MRAVRYAAAALALTALPAFAQDLQGHLQAGNEARCRRDAEGALAQFQAALALDSMSYAALWQTSQALVDIALPLPNAERARRDSLYAAALALAQRAVNVNAQGADGHFMVAVATGRVALTKGARERVRYAGVVRESALRAIELDSSHAGAMHVMGRWNAEIQRLPGVTKFFAKTFLGASIFSEANWDNAFNYYDRAIALEPDNIYHHLDMAEALMDAGRREEAVPHLEQVGRMEPGCDPMDDAYQQQAVALLERARRR